MIGHTATSEIYNLIIPYIKLEEKFLSLVNVFNELPQF